MANLDQLKNVKPIKMLNVGDSGCGKTGALACLVDAGYNVRILDCDNGLDVLPSFIKKKENIKNVAYHTITEKLKAGPFGPVPKSIPPKAFPKVLKMLNHWKTVDEDLGPIETWGQNDVLVIDSLTMVSNQALWWARSFSGSHLKKYIEQADWGMAMAAIEGLLAMLYEDDIKCNVIVNTHLAPVGEGTDLKMYPSTLGQKLPPKVGRYFNTMVLTKTLGSGQNLKRVIRTTPERGIACKLPVQGLPEELPLDGGLLKIFKAIKDKKGN